MFSQIGSYDDFFHTPLFPFSPHSDHADESLTENLYHGAESTFFSAEMNRQTGENHCELFPITPSLRTTGFSSAACDRRDTLYEGHCILQVARLPGRGGGQWPHYTCDGGSQTAWPRENTERQVEAN